MIEINCDRDDEELRDSYRNFLLMRLNGTDLDAETTQWGYDIIDEFQDRFGLPEAQQMAESVQREFENVTRVE